MILAFSNLSSFGAWTFAQPRARDHHATDHIIIKFKAEELAKIPGLNRPDGPKSLVSRLGLPAGAELVETTLGRLRHGPAPGPAQGQVGKIDFSRHLYLRLPRGLDPAQALQRLRHHRLVEYVERDGTGQASFTTPNDPDFTDQWHHQNPAVPSGSVRADIATPDAWDLTRGSTNVIVAIVDTGINAALPEFEGRLVAGYDFIDDDPDPEDSTGHGTAVTSIIGANANNFSAIAGIDWNCKLMPLKVVTPEDTFLNSWLADAIDFATDHGAKVINLSLATFSEDNETVTRAVTNAIAHGVIVVGVTSNEGMDVIPFPGNLPELITVGATDSADRRAEFSDYGPEVDLVAPGVAVCTLDLNGDIEFPSGTSASAPMVSGVAALIASVKPDVTQEQMRVLLCAGADDGVGDPAEDAAGYDIYYGWGRLNAYNSLVLALTAIDPVTVTPEQEIVLAWNSPPNAGSKHPYRIESAASVAGPWTRLPSSTNITYTAGRAFWTNDTPVTATDSGGQFYRVSLTLE